MKTVSLSLLVAAAATSSCAALSTPEVVTRGPNPAIKAMAQGMNLLKPVFAAEAKLQAAVLGGSVDEDSVASDIAALKKANKVLVYTYGLSPFSAEALVMLDASGYEYTNIELGKEWFLLGGEESVTRVALSKEVENGATSLPKVFIGGKCIGGCSELAGLIESGEFETLARNAKASKKGETPSTGLFSFFN